MPAKSKYAKRQRTKLLTKGGDALTGAECAAPVSPVTSAVSREQPLLLDRTPKEIWAEIFTTVCLSHLPASSDFPITAENAETFRSSISYDSLHPNHPTWILSSVCRSWRQIMEFLPFAWANIRIENSFHQLESKHHHKLFSSRLQLILERSKIVPLDLTFYFHNPAKFRLFSKTTVHKTLMDLVMPHYPRWRSFSVMDISYDLMILMLLYFGASGDLAPNFEMLEVFSLHICLSSDPLPLNKASINPVFSKLRVLSTRGRLTPESISGFFPCERLQDVELGSDINAATIVSRFVCAEKLAVLQIFERESGEDLEDADPVSQFSPNVTLPNVTELSLKYWVVGQMPPDLTAPNLASLKIETITTRDTLESIISFLNRSACRLLELHLHHIECLPPKDMLNSLLHAVPGVTRLHIGVAEELIITVLVDPNRGFGIPKHHEMVANDLVGLLAEREGDDGPFVLCPHLESLRIQLATRQYIIPSDAVFYGGESESDEGDGGDLEDEGQDPAVTEEMSRAAAQALEGIVVFNFASLAGMAKIRHLQQLKSIKFVTNIPPTTSAQKALRSLEDVKGLEVSFILQDPDVDRWKWEREWECLPHRSHAGASKAR